MKTINHLIAGCCTKFAAHPAMGMVFEPALSYTEIGALIKKVAVSLLESGVKKGSRVSILAENSPRWGAVYLAIVRLGAIAVPILPDFLESDVRHIVTEAEVTILFATGKQLEKLYELQHGILKKIVIIDDSPAANAPLDTIGFSDFLLLGEKATSRQKERIAELAGSVKEEDLAAIIYTSGTSGHSKAVMLTHKNLVSNVASAQKVIEIKQQWTFLSILPLSHTYEFTIGFLLALSCGCRIVYLGGRPTPSLLQKACATEKPSVACVVPMVMEKIYKKRVLPTLEKHKLLRLLARVPALRRRIYRKIGSKLLHFFGGRLELLAIGGAAINREVEEFLHQARFPYVVGYGLTEAAPLISGGPYGDSTVAVGSAGKAVPGVQIKIVHPLPASGIGEIHARGSNVMKGYFRNEKLTAETIDADGWLATGDLGYLDDSGNLFIMGRSKSVIVLSHGENIYPEAIEDRIYSSMYVVECLVIANNDRLEALVYLDYDLVDDETEGQSQEQKKAHIDALLASIKKTVNAGLPPYAQISRMMERTEPFIKTATHKIKRFLYCQSSFGG